MQANEFFKKVGIDAVRSYLAAYEDDLTDDLKRLVESHELVEAYGGLEKCKFYVSFLPFVLAIKRSTLQKAIADVESCQ